MTCMHVLYTCLTLVRCCGAFVCACVGLHPLQRALLLQNQRTLHEGVEPIPHTPPTAIPHHMTPQSCSSSPILQSPGMSGYSVQPLTPLRSNVFVMPAGTQPTFEPTVLPQQRLLSSMALQHPVSKLAYLNSSPELLHFPNAGGLDRIGGSQLNPDLVDKDLASLWLQHNQILAKQVGVACGGCGLIPCTCTGYARSARYTTSKDCGKLLFVWAVSETSLSCVSKTSQNHLQKPEVSGHGPKGVC